MFSLYVIKYFLFFDNLTINYINKLVYIFFGLVVDSFFYKLIGLFASFFLAGIIYVFYLRVIPVVINFFKELSKVEKKYIMVVFCFGFCLSLVISYVTTAFSIPFYDGDVQIYEVVYTSDSGAIGMYDAFFNFSCVDNDIRQPLYGVFAFPFALCGKVLAEFLFFVPSGYEYMTSMMIIQFILLAISNVLISRMLGIDESEKKLFYFLLVLVLRIVYFLF